jgi:hypothetical protein
MNVGRQQLITAIGRLINLPDLPSDKKIALATLAQQVGKGGIEVPDGVKTAFKILGYLAGILFKAIFSNQNNRNLLALPEKKEPTPQGATATKTNLVASGDSDRETPGGTKRLPREDRYLAKRGRSLNL